MDIKPFVGQWVRLPVTFWDQFELGYAKKNHPSDWQTRYDVCKITKHIPRQEGCYESLEFADTESDKYKLTKKEATQLSKEGRFQGTSLGRLVL